MIPKRQLGETKYAVSLFSLGGEATLNKPELKDEAEAIINRAIDLGVNYIDTSPTYGDGHSENNIGRVMEYRRKEVFLATKTRDRSYEGTMRLLEKSLERLRTGYLDLYQIHNMRTKEDLEETLAPNGAVKALEELKEKGVIRYLGITGHRDPDVLLQGIKEYPFDCILMSLNAGDIHHASFQKELLKEAVSKKMGIIAMKVTASERLFQRGGIANMKQALDYVFSLPISTAIVGISNLKELEENAKIAAEFKPLDEKEMKYLESLTEKNSEEANYFKINW